MTGQRGACPGLTDPMPTGDGLLARLAVTRAVSIDECAALCRAARMRGNGIIEITARGSIQVRGLTIRSTAAFAAAVEAIDIADAAGGRVVSNPLAGLDPHEIFDVTGIADRLRGVLVERGLAAKLAPKVSVVIDGGGALHLDAIPCDIRLRAEAIRDGVRFRFALAGHDTGATSHNVVAAPEAVGAAVGVLEAIAAKGPSARAHDLLPLPGGERVGARGLTTYQIIREPPHPPAFAALRWATSPHRGEVKSARLPAEPIGTHALRDGSVALGIGLAFGHSDADSLQNLIEEARRAGAASVRPAPGRALLVTGVAAEKTQALTAAAHRLGFIVAPDDPRRRVVACAGAPACASAEIPTRALAPAIAAAAPLLDRQTTIHISGCAKGCAHPGPAALTIVGMDGKCGLVCNGRAQDAPVEFVTLDDLPEHLGRLAALQEAEHG